jgi:Ca2+-binding RTX toxin-like protein
LLTGAGATAQAAAAAVVAEIASQVATQAQNNATLDLNDAAVITSVITAAGTNAGADSGAIAANAEGAASVISATNQVVTDAASQTGTDLLTTLAQVAAVAQGSAAAALSNAGAGTADISQVQSDFTGANLTTAVQEATVGNVAGVNGPDNVVGTANADLLAGYGGNDTILGLDGNDTLVGGDGDDQLDGGAGVDRSVYSDATGAIAVDLAGGTVSGPGVGTDTLSSVESIRGSDFADSYVATGWNGASVTGSVPSSYNEFEGLGGDDVITGNGVSRVSYLSATSEVTVDIAAGTASGDGSVGNDTFSGVSSVRGSSFGDTIFGSNNVTGVEFIEPGAGDDFIDGRGGFDRVSYGMRVDNDATGGITVDLAAGTLTGDGSIGSDTLRSIEAARGTNFADSFDATGFTASSTNAGSAGVNGSGAAFNEFEGLGGDDAITGNGNTRLVFYNATAGVTVDLAAGTADGDASVGSDTFSGVSSVAGTGFADALSGSINLSGIEMFDGRGGDDTFDGRGGFDQAVYNMDAATGSGISVDLAAGTVTGDASVGTDTLIEVEAVRGTNFADSYVATGYAGASVELPQGVTFNEFEGLAGDDSITGNGNTRVSYVSASAGVTVDLAAGTATGNGSVGSDSFTGVSRARGSNFADSLSGDGNFNVLEGQNGNDVLDGRGGGDTLIGGGNADTFVYADGYGAGTVNDFVQAQGDKIDLTGVSGVHDLADVQAAASQLGANTVIDFGSGNTLQLNNVTLANLTAPDFLFH